MTPTNPTLGIVLLVLGLFGLACAIWVNMQEPFANWHRKFWSRVWDEMGRCSMSEYGMLIGHHGHLYADGGYVGRDHCICHEHKPTCDCGKGAYLDESWQLRPRSPLIGDFGEHVDEHHRPLPLVTPATARITFPYVRKPGESDGFERAPPNYDKHATDALMTVGLPDTYQNVARRLKEQVEIRFLIRDVCVTAGLASDEGFDSNLRNMELCDAVNRLRERAPYMCFPCAHKTCMHPEACTKAGKCSSKA